MPGTGTNILLIRNDPIIEGPLWSQEAPNDGESAR